MHEEPSPSPRTTIRILDGGLGTTLEQNHNISFSPSTSPLWSSHLLLTDPEALLACQRSFADIPVDVLLTATYQVSIHGFALTKTPQHPAGIADPSHIPPLLEKAIQIAHDAAAGTPSSSHPCAATVALSLGPYGACMIPSQEYSGAYDARHDSQEDLYLWHRQRMELFARVPDVRRRITYIALETIPRLDEIVALRRALAAVPELSSGVPFWMSCLFPNEGDDNTPDGSSPEAVIRAMLDPSLAEAVPWAVGINCTKVWKLDALLRRYEAAIHDLLKGGTIQKWPALVLYPDGTNGEVYNTTTQRWEIPQGTEQQERVPWETQLTKAVRATEARGDWPEIIVGGCCRALPSDIKRLRDSLTK